VARDEAGFTLIEMVAVLAIIAMLSALVMPHWPHGTTRPQLEAYAFDIAGLLKADRNAAIRTRARVETRLDSKARAVASGAGAGEVRLPDRVGAAGRGVSCAGQLVDGRRRSCRSRPASLTPSAPQARPAPCRCGSTPV
jgi:prepilin-type N-terminal cleavage/methylation domain-containing protein